VAESVKPHGALIRGKPKAGFLGLGVVHVALAGAEAPRTLHDALLAARIGGLNGITFIGGAENPHRKKTRSREVG
jgi:hypothetical protein